MKRLLLPIVIILSLPLLFQSTPTEILKLKTFDALIQTPEESGNFTILNITEEDVLAQATSTQITGTMLGKDPDTQITALITGNVVSLRREVSESVRLDLDGGTAYTVILIQDGISNTIKINGGSDSIITITQND